MFPFQKEFERGTPRGFERERESECQKESKMAWRKETAFPFQKGFERGKGTVFQKG